MNVLNLRNNNETTSSKTFDHIGDDKKTIMNMFHKTVGNAGNFNNERSSSNTSAGNRAAAM